MSTSTKNIILNVASQLFADNGYGNTSIRDIAKAADVNISAINYHFNSKNGLYAEVLNENTQRMGEVMQGIRDRTNNTEEFTIEVFNYFMDESSIFLNSIKMFLMNNLPLDKELVPKSCLEGAKGPPGVQILIELIREEKSYKGDDETLLLWGARNILHSMTMIALVSQSSLIKMSNENELMFTEAEKIESIRRNVKATLNFIR